MDPFASRSDLFFRHSWKAPTGGLLLVGVAGLLSTLILGLIYGYAMAFIPFIYIKLILMIGYPFAVGVILSLAVRQGKVRNDLLVGLTGVGFGLLADYTGWVAWTAATLGNSELLMLFFYPGDILYFMQEVAEVGIYVIGNSRPTGAILYLVWLVEAAVVVGLTAYTVINNHLGTPFCEECNQWVENERYIGLFEPLLSQVMFRQKVNQGNFSVMGELKPSNTGNNFTKVTMLECQTCHNFRLLNVKALRVWVNDKNKVESKEETILSNLRVPSSLMSIIQRLIQEQNQLE